MREGALLEAVIGVKCPLAPAGGGLSIQPVGWEHHEDEVGVELLLLFSDAADIVWFHTCGGDILVRLAETPAAPTLRFNQRGDGVAMSYPLRFCSEVDPDLVLVSVGPVSAQPICL